MADTALTALAATTTLTTGDLFYVVDGGNSRKIDFDDLVTQVEGALDHGGIGGLGDDDHTVYVLADGSRQITGSQDFAASTSLTWNSVAILADAAGTMTLSNIDALDATTQATIESGLDYIATTLTAASANTFAIGECAYVNASGEAVKTDASAEATARGPCFMAVEAVTATTSGLFAWMGTISGLTGLTAGSEYYLSETAGAITTTRPSTSGAIVRPIGVAKSTTVMLFNPMGYAEV